MPDHRDMSREPGYAQNGESVYGVPVSEHVADEAEDFMHAQSSIGGVMIGQYLCSLIFGLIMVAQWRSLGMEALMAKEDDITNHNRGWSNAYLQWSLHNWWIQALSYLIFWTCIGMAIIAISKKMVQSGTAGNFQICCCLESICAVCGCCQCMQYGCYLIVVAMFVASTGDAATQCNTIINYNNAWDQTPHGVSDGNGDGILPIHGLQTTTGGPAGGGPQFRKCIELVDGFHKIAINLCINLVIMVCFSGCAVAACAFGARTAKEMEDAIDDEEDGQGRFGTNKEATDLGTNRAYY